MLLSSKQDELEQACTHCRFFTTYSQRPPEAPIPCPSEPHEPEKVVEDVAAWEWGEGGRGREKLHWAGSQS